MANKYLSQFIDAVLDIKTRGDMREFLGGIFTLQELEEIPKRLEIIRLLKTGLPQHAIARKLGVGIATVTRGSKELAKGRFKNV